ncbi:MAG: hypothetical protein RL701_1980 [Pseudomonadota bacterium]
MAEFRFDEDILSARLRPLPAYSKGLFAWLVALRILPAYRRFHTKTGRGDAAALRALSERLWRDLQGDTMTEDELQAAADLALRLVPSEDEGWDDETQANAEDAASALHYALRARAEDDAQLAAWSARCAYSTFDYLVAQAHDSFTPATEVAILEHSLVQSELARQQQDLEDIIELTVTSAPVLAYLPLRERSETLATKLWG